MVRLGVDLGTVRIGMATCDELGMVATPYKVLESTSDLVQDALIVSGIAENVKACEIIVGMPRNMNGTYGDAAKRVEAFCEELSKAAKNVEIKTWDERLSTVQASRILVEADMSRKRRKEVVDKSAAAIILQGYLDRIRGL